ncbi:MAG TPA: hypothetical protein VNJ02_16430 [Vicinamibacterales bacterium]|nr:hypothetical protein [Vicinamibacterales bacterium]
MTRRFFVLLILLVACSGPIGAQPDPATLGPRVGAQVPEFSGVDQFGRRQTLQTVLGAKGAMLVFFRSADW